LRTISFSWHIRKALESQTEIRSSEATKYFSHWHGSLLTVCDACVSHFRSMEPKKVSIVRYKHSSGGSCVRKLSGIFRADQPRILRRGHADIPPSKTSSDNRGNMFVQVELDRHPLRCFFKSIPVQLRVDQRRAISPDLAHENTLSPHLFLDFLDVIEIICQGGMYFRKRERGNMRDDLIRRHSLVLVPRDDIQHADTVTRNASPSSTDAWCLDDPFGRGVLHN
jgi:hypothetical protein